MTAPIRVFVYGSLRRGGKHESELRDATYKGEAILPMHRLYLYEEGYPAAAPVEPGVNEQIVGELYEVSEERLRLLDQFEECPSLYQRELVTLFGGGTAYAYLITKEKSDSYEPLF